MAETDVFERRLRAALARHTDDGPTDFDALEFARTVAAKEPRRRGLGVILGWRAVAIPRVAWVFLLLAGLLAAMLGGLVVAGSHPSPWQPRADVPTPAPIAWPTWSPASAADTALVDRMNAFWNAPDAAVLEDTWADDLVFTVEGEVYGGLDGLRANLPTIGTFSRVGDVAMTIDPVPGLWNRRVGSRFLAFVESTSGELRDIVLEMNDKDRIAVLYNDLHRTPEERARMGYTRVDFTTMSRLDSSVEGQAALAGARLRLVETDRADARDVPGCQDPFGRSTYVFVHLRLEDTLLDVRGLASDRIEVRGQGGERLDPLSCPLEPAFELASGAQDGWVGVAVPEDTVGRLSLVYQHISQTQDSQVPEVSEALIPFDLPPG